MTWLEFLRQRLGRNWVLAYRRTARIVARYGDDVVCISRKRWNELEREYEALTGRKAWERF